MDTDREQLCRLRDEHLRVVARLQRAEGELAAERARRLATLIEIDEAQRRAAAAEQAASIAREVLADTWALGPQRGEGVLTEAELVRRVATSRLFDASWYLAAHPDVAAAGVHPATHFVRHGAAEGRSCGPAFDEGFYLGAYPDVAAAGVHPLLHFLQSGCIEGRLPRPAAPPAAGEPS